MKRLKLEAFKAKNLNAEHSKKVATLLGQLLGNCQDNNQTTSYDGDGADDTPPDAHYEAGMGCIDCL